MAPPQSEKQLAVSTSRSKGAVGNNPLVYRRFRELNNEQFRHNLRFHHILDFGAGKDAKHTEKLIADGFPLVQAFDFPENCNTDRHISELVRQYKVVLVSNVLNVQKNDTILFQTLGQIRDACEKNGFLVANYPAEPRHHNDLSNERLISLLGVEFSLTDVVGPQKGKGTLVIVGRKK